MASVLEPQPTPSQAESRVEAELRRATHAIRTTDLLTGIATVAAVILTYAVLLMLVDRQWELPNWSRQLSLAGLLALVGILGYRMIVRPLRSVINPRFAARRVESTVEGATNAVINWVDLRERNLPASVRTAIGTEAAQELADADRNRTVDTRPMLWMGGLAAFLLAVLAVMFVICKPPQFFSLLGRAFNPFTSVAIASQTQIRLMKPADGDVSIPTGEPLTIAVEIDGRVPDPESPERVRLQYRHNLAAEYEEYPLTVAATHREWSAQLPDYIIQNGFSYRIAAGDAVTPEYRVSVRTRPQFTSYEVLYTFPDYLRMQPEIGHEPRIEAYRGTQVTLIATTNRELRVAKLQFSDRADALTGVVDADNPTAARFTFTLDQSLTYRLLFEPRSGESGLASPIFPIKVLEDFPPTVVIDQPADAEQPIPANGTLTIDGTIGDDFGIDTVTLKLQLLGDPGTPLTPKPYLNGANRSFRREADGTFPTSLMYKDSLALNALQDSTGKPIALQEGMTLEYWLEATDNCTVPRPHVGRSAVKRIRVLPPIVEPAQKAAQDQNAARRQTDEQQARQQQRERLQTEDRPPPPPVHNEQPQPQPQEANPGEGQKQPGQGGSGSENAAPQPGDMPPNADPQNGQPAKGGNTQPGNNPPPDDTMPPDDEVKRMADQVQQALAEEQKQPGEARNNGEAGQPGSSQPMTGEQAAEAKPGEPSNSSDSAQAKPGESPSGSEDSSTPKPDSAAQPKEAGKVEPPPQPAESKAAPADKPQAGPNAAANQPQGETPKSQPSESNAGQEKANASPPEKPTDAGNAKGSEKGSENPDGTPPSTPSGQAKPNTAPERGQQRPDSSQKSSPDSPQDAAPQTGGRGRSDRPTDPAGAKPKPDASQNSSKNGEPQNPNASQEKPPPETGPMDQPGSPSEPGNSKSEGQPPPNGSDSGQSGQSGQPGNPDQRGSEKGPPPEKGELDREIGSSGDKNSTPTAGPEDVERLTRDADKLNSRDPAERKQAEEQFDDLLGKKKREELQKNVQQSQSGETPGERQQAQENVEELTKKAAQNEKSQMPSQQEVDALKKKAEDLASNDPQKREAAEKEFDDLLGKKGREELQKNVQNQKNGQSGSSQQEQAAQKANELTQQAARNGKQGKPTPEQVEDLKKSAQDLASDDPQKREVAEKKFDDLLGKKGREELQKQAQKQQNGTPQEQQAAGEKVEDLAQDAARQQKAQQQDQQKAREQARQDAEKLAQQAGDLASDNPEKQKAAEKAFDEKIGQEKREKLQQAMNDLKSDDPEKQKAGREQLEKMAQDARKQAQAAAKQQQEEQARQEQAAFDKHAQ
ncbi:MAG: hypothetical protein LC104_03895, partial [Bacteroidales bacterium]|nr:hypothetical protein [Bacteroidales bacterium]